MKNELNYSRRTGTWEGPILSSICFFLDNLPLSSSLLLLTLFLKEGL